MKLTELDPRWISTDGDTRHGMGMGFNCPNHPLDEHGGFAVWFENPLDGGAPISGYPLWLREGDNFETIAISPSIIVATPEYRGCHFFVRNGELVPA